MPPEPAVCLGQRMVLLRPDPQVLVPPFLVYWLYGSTVDTFIDQVSQGSTVRHLNMGDIPDIPLALPPPQTQQAIVGYLDEATNDIDAVARRLDEQIVLLGEYRQAPITSAVTGQLDELVLNGSGRVVDGVSVEVPS